jgi:GMP synthase (glutamine-hydrolysing)
MSHGDDIRKAPAGFQVVGCTETNPIAAVEDPARRLYGMLFHPEVVHTEEGTKVLGNFLDACGCRRDWNARSFVEEATERAANALHDSQVLYNRLRREVITTDLLGVLFASQLREDEAAAAREGV